MVRRAGIYGRGDSGVAAHAGGGGASTSRRLRSDQSKAGRDRAALAAHLAGAGDEKAAGGRETAIWQRARVWRDGEGSSVHHPEFTMLEWYRAGADLDVIAADVESLLRTAALAAGTRWFRRGADRCDPFSGLERVTVLDAFAAEGIDLSLFGRSRCAGRGDSGRRAAPAGLRVAEGDGWEDMVFRVLGERIEPRLGFARPCLLCDHRRRWRPWRGGRPRIRASRCGLSCMSAA